ncbi:hypothetical protein AB0I22_11765 [Streptomyces sp. NPDC050610]|uniref:hypothetical protein n=1 Tax=Streptomyces sp. NPDC050610 TaxID=3157097 RepID=UPI00341378D3
MRRLRTGAFVALLLVVVPGCGVESTGVIDVGQPASGAKRPGASEREAVLYFLSPMGLRPVRRPASGAVSAQQAVRLLMGGPDEAERRRGMQTEVPKMTGVHVTTGKGRVGVQLPMDVRELSPVVRSQLVCTAADNDVPGGKPASEVKVELSGGGEVVSNLVCDANSAFPAGGMPTPPKRPVPTMTGRSGGY